jgi:hypothetical protein
MKGRTLGTYDEDFDRDAAEQSEVRVINVTDEVVRFQIDQAPGSKPRRYRLQPYGTPGSDAGTHIPRNYTIETKGVGRAMIRPTIEALTEREVYPGGPRLPMVVSEENGRAEDFRRKWQTALADKGKAKLPRIVLTGTEGERVEAELSMPSRAPAAAAAPAEREDVEDQTGGRVDVDPDLDPDNTPDPGDDLPIAGRVPTEQIATPPRARARARGGKAAGKAAGA